MKKLLFLLFFAGCLSGPSAPTPQNQPMTSVTLGWVLSTGTNIFSQTLSYGVVSNTYTNDLSLGPKITQFQVTNLLYSTAYFFALRCTDSNGLTSAYSAQLQYTTTNAPPLNVPPPPPTNLRVISAP